MSQVLAHLIRVAVHKAAVSLEVAVHVAVSHYFPFTLYNLAKILGGPDDWSDER